MRISDWSSDVCSSDLYGGWSEGAYMSAELRGGRRRIATVLVASLGLVTLLYLLVNFAYIRALGPGGIAGTAVVAADLAERAAGSGGAVLNSFLVAVSALTSAHCTSSRKSDVKGKSVSVR